MSTWRIRKRGVLVRMVLACVLACALVPQVALADTQLGLRITDSSQSQGSGEGGQPGSTSLGIRVTDSANQTPLTSDVTFDVNGGVWVDGSTAAKTLSVAYGAATTAPEPPTREGHNLAGWSSSPKGSVELLPSFTTTAAVWYAVWTPIEYTVTFDSSGGSKVPSQQVVAGSFVSAPEAPTLEGYGFIGWYESADYAGERWDFASTKMPAHDVVLYAKWTLIVACKVPTSASLTVDDLGAVAGAKGTFSSSSVEPVEVTSIKSTQSNEAALVFADAATLTGAKVTVAPPEGSGSKVEVPLDAAAGVKADFAVSAGGSLPVSFELALPEGALINFSDTAREIAQLSYTVEASPFYLQDKTTGAIYTAVDIKTQAEDISAKGEASRYYAQYSSYLADDSMYSCKVKWGDGLYYDVRIIGINHDNKSDGSGKAGLTFQFVNLLNATYQMNPTNTSEGGWGASALRASMNSGAIWDQVPPELQNSIVSVEKEYCPTFSSHAVDDIVSASDKLFVASYCELAGNIPLSFGGDWWNAKWLSAEGFQYEYWSSRGVVGDDRAKFSSLKKSQPSTTSSTWWERSVHPYNDLSFVCVSTTGAPSGNNVTTNLRSVCPCFCL